MNKFPDERNSAYHDDVEPPFGRFGGSFYFKSNDENVWYEMDTFVEPSYQELWVLLTLVENK